MDVRTRWYYAHGGKKFGPVTTRELRNLAMILQLGEHDMVWRKGMKEWVAADRVEGLFPEPGGRPGLRDHAQGPPA